MDFLEKKKTQVEEQQVFSQIEENEQVNVPMEEPYYSVNREQQKGAREKALEDVRKLLSLQDSFAIEYKGMNLEESKQELEKDEEYNSKISYLEAEEKELEKLKEKYDTKEEVKNEDTVQCARVDIFKAYYRNQYGDVGEQIKQKQEQKNSLKQQKAQKEQTIVDRIAEYKTKSAEELETRRSRINAKFENEATSSKNKKEKGRKKGAALKESGAIGATEETYAMLKDMNEQQKKVNKWKKKHPKIKPEEIELTGKEFEVVFKNKSGSALNIKAVQEKIAKLFIKASESTGEESLKYKTHAEMLLKVLNVVSAANGIEFDGESYNLFKKEDKTAAEKVEYANAVYASVMAEYEEKVNLIKEGRMVYGEEQKTEQKKKQNEAAENNNAEINKEQNLQKDKETFTRIVSGLRKKEEKQKDAVPEKIWEAAINICSSYDHSKYVEKEDALLARKQDLQKETEFMNRLVEGDISGVFKFTVDKLAELSKQGITIEKCINQTEIEKNPEGYTKLASIIKVMNHLRNNLNDDNIGIVMGNTSFFKDKTALMESLLTISNLADYDNYLARAKEFKSLNERQKKAFKNREYRMQRRSERLKSEFFENVEKKGMEEVTFSDMQSEDLETKLEDSALTDLFDENVKELQDYVDELKAKKDEIERQKDKFHLITEIGSAVKMFMTASAMKKINKKRMNDSTQNVEEMKKRKDEAKPLEKDEKKEKALEAFRKNLKTYGAYAGQRDILEKLTANMKDMSDEEIRQKVEEIMALRSDSNAKKEFEKYLQSKGKDLYQLEIERQIVLAKMDYAEGQEEAKEEAKLRYLAYRKVYQEKYEKDKKWDEKKEIAELAKTNSFWGKIFGTDIRTDYANKVNLVEKKIKEQDKKVDENGEEIVEQGTAYGDLLSYFKGSYERQKKDAQNAYAKVKDFMKENKDDFEYIMARLTDEEIALYLEKRDEKLLAISDHIEDILENSQRLLAENMEKYLEQYKDDGDFNELEGMQEYVELNSSLKSILEIRKQEGQEEFAEEMLQEVLKKNESIAIGHVDAQREQMQKINADWEMIQKRIADAEDVLKDAKEEADIKETEEDILESAQEAYEANKKYTNACFAVPVKQSLKDKAINKADSFMNGDKNEQGIKDNKVNNLFVEHELIKKYRTDSEKLMKEKDQKGEFGLSYNTLAIQSFLTDNSEEKYEKVQAENLFDKKYNKKKDDYQLKQDDFKMAVMHDQKGITTINFQRLMYKRNKLMEWVKANKHLEVKENGKWYKDIWDNARSLQQQKYDRRLERLEKLNNYLKCYSEANGVDFVTGELFCESGMSEEEVIIKVKKANLYLSQAMTDMWSYLKNPDVDIEEAEEPEAEKKQEEQDQSVLDKLKEKWENISSQEKELLEPYSNQQSIEMNALLEWSKGKEVSGLEHKAKKRTAHFTGELTTKIMECQAAVKAGVGIATVKDKKSEQSEKAMGGQIQSEGSVTVLSMEFLSKYQTKLKGMEASAFAKGKLEVGKASANANLKATILNKKGELDPHVQLALGAELALVNLEANVGGQILGVGLEAEIGLMVGLAARFNVEIANGIFKLDMKAALGLGFSCELQFDFSGLLDKIKDVAKSKSVKAKDLVVDTLINLGVGINSDFVRNHLLEQVKQIDFDIMQFEREEEQQQQQQQVVEQNNKEKTKEDKGGN